MSFQAGIGYAPKWLIWVPCVLSLAALSEAEIPGAAPKAASLHDLRCAPDPAGRWSCGITIDV